MNAASNFFALQALRAEGTVDVVIRARGFRDARLPVSLGSLRP